MAVSSTLLADLILSNTDTSTTRQTVRHVGATRQYIWAMTSRGMSIRDTTDGSARLIGQIDLSALTGGQWYTDGQDLNATRQNNLSRFSQPWAQLAHNVSWYDSEMVWNANSAFRDDYVVAKLVDLAKEKKARAAMEFAESLESALFATPDKATMEGDGATHPMSLMATHNDHFGTGSGAGKNGNFYNPSTGAFTTVQGIDNTAAGKALWRQQFVTYSDTAAVTTTSKNLINALDEAYDLVTWVPPPAAAIPNAYSGDMWEGGQWPKYVGVTSYRGKQILQALARAQGDRWQNAGVAEISKGPGGALNMNPTFGGMEIVASQKFTEGTFYLSDYTSATPTLADEFGGQGKGPRIVLVNAETFKTKFHMDKYFTPKPQMNYEKQFYANTIWYDTYTQNQNSCRLYGLIVCPGTSSGTGTSKTYTATTVYSS